MSRIDYLRMQFADPDLERDFAAYYDRRNLTQARIAILLGIALVVGDATVDFIADARLSSNGNQIRLFLFVPLAALGLLGTYLAAVRANFQWYTTIWSLAAGSLLLLVMLQIDRDGWQGLTSWVGLMNWTFVIFFIVVILGLEFKRAALVSTVFFVEFMVMLRLSPGFQHIEYYAYHVFTLLLLALFIGYFREIYVRKDFLADVILREEKGRSEELLYSMIPAAVVGRIKQQEFPIADSYAEATILFADIVGFTRLTGKISPGNLVDILNRIFSDFDTLTEAHGLEKVKTIGDAYMVAGASHRSGDVAAESMVRLAVGMQGVVSQVSRGLPRPVAVRIGIHTGAVVGGVIGTRRYQYDYWGETVNIASRLESAGEAGRIQVSEATYWRVHDKFDFEPRGEIELDGIGRISAYLLAAPAAGSDEASSAPNLRLLRSGGK